MDKNQWQVGGQGISRKTARPPPTQSGYVWMETSLMSRSMKPHPARRPRQGCSQAISAFPGGWRLAKRCRSRGGMPFDLLEAVAQGNGSGRNDPENSGYSGMRDGLRLCAGCGIGNQTFARGEDAPGLWILPAGRSGWRQIVNGYFGCSGTNRAAAVDC
jgi:hypothetical protein